MRYGLAISIVLICALMLPASGATEEHENLKKAVVLLEGESNFGSGFVVGLTDEACYIVTAGHVVQGDPAKIRATFYTKRGRPASVTLDRCDPTGLALLHVKLELAPSGVRPLYISQVPELYATEILTLVGHPEGTQRAWSIINRPVVDTHGTALTFDGTVPKGYSGSPVVENDNVVGVIVERHRGSNTTMAVPAGSVRNFVRFKPGLLKDVPGQKFPEYIRARQQLKLWGIDFTDRAFIESIINGQVDAVRLFLQANPIWSMRTFKSDPWEEGNTSHNEEDSNGNSTITAEVTALMMASMCGQSQVVQELLTAGANVKERTDGGTALHWAAMYGRLDSVKMLMEAGADVTAAGLGGDTPLAYAARGGQLAADDFEGIHLGQEHTEVIKLLLESGAKIDAANEDGMTPLARAVEVSNESTARLLLSNGARVCALDTAVENGSLSLAELLLSSGAKMEDYPSLLCVAAEKNDVDMAQLLIERGANVNSPGGIYGNPMVTSLQKDSLDVLKLLLDKGANVNASRSRDSDSPLRIALTRGNVSAAAMLIAKGADINAMDCKRYQLPLLHEAIRDSRHRDSKAMVSLLLDSGVDVNTRSCTGETALQQAIEDSEVEIADVLLRRGADVGIIYSSGSSVLHKSAMTGNKEMTAMLLTKGIDVNARDNAGKTPLDVAVGSGKKDVVALLLANGADAKIGHRNPEKDLDGWTALHEAVVQGNLAIVKDILEKDPESVKCVAHNLFRNLDGWTALHEAAGTPRCDIIALLMKYGADMNALTKNGWSPLGWAEEHGQVVAADMLKRQGAHSDQPAPFGTADVQVSNTTKQHFVATITQDNAKPKQLGGGAGYPVNPQKPRVHGIGRVVSDGSGDKIVLQSGLREVGSVATDPSDQRNF